MNRIFIDATPLCQQPTGIGLYTLNLINYLDKLQSKNNFELIIYYQPGAKNWFKGYRKLPIQLQNFSNSYIFNLPVRITNLLFDYVPQVFPIVLEQKLNNPCLFHGTNFTTFSFKQTKKVITIHDLTFLKYPHYIDTVVKQYVKRIQKCISFVDLILTVSQSTKQDIIEYMGVNPDKIHVTPLATCLDQYLTLPSLHNITSNHPYAQYFNQPYILFVSTIEPRKNIINLIKAFEHLKQKYKLDHQLILIGKKGWKYTETFMMIDNSPYKNQIHHLSYLSTETVALFYKNADVFVYPSFYEGFGLPILEAMSFGVPVVTSNTSSLPEVAGDSALKIDPTQPLEIAEAIYQIIDDRELRNNLIKKGLERINLFSWQKTAQLTLEAYQSIL